MKNQYLLTITNKISNQAINKNDDDADDESNKCDYQFTRDLKKKINEKLKWRSSEGIESKPRS